MFESDTAPFIQVSMRKVHIDGGFVVVVCLFLTNGDKKVGDSGLGKG